jgi:hypothetical protein
MPGTRRSTRKLHDKSIIHFWSSERDYLQFVKLLNEDREMNIEKVKELKLQKKGLVSLEEVLNILKEPIIRGINLGRRI